MQPIKVKFKRLHPNAVTPKYAKPGDAGMDLVAISILNTSLEQVSYDTGISVEIPEGYVGLIFPRSSIRNYGIVLSNAVGVIDSGYRGSIQATFNYYGSTKQRYTVGDRIGQLIILPYPQIEFEEVEELSETIRGTGGFGSTGNK